MTVIVVDDHLLADAMGGMTPPTLLRSLQRSQVATTNLYYYRLCRAAFAARGGTLTRSWSPEYRDQAARALTQLSPDIEILPLTMLAPRMAELARDFSLSALGAEAVAATEAYGGRLCVWAGDDGPRIRQCCSELNIGYRTITRP